jgi:hypothetical protein
MHYLGLVYLDEKRWLDAPEAERKRVMAECDLYGEELRQSGQLLGGAPLHPTATATTLRRSDDRLVMTDGPFAETREVLGGYHLFDCKDLDEAIAVSARFPGLRVGMTMEVRPVMSEE